MAASNRLFQRYLWLVDTIYSAGHITRDEIDRRWAHSHYNDMRENEYGERNFHRHREAIMEMFGIEIVCNRATKEYFLANLGDIENGGMRAWLIDTFAIHNSVNIAGGMRDRIFFEKIPAGTRYLSSIVGAMQEGRKLMVTYQRFDRLEPHTFLLAPYCLKVFKQRWYLIGKPEDHPEEPEPRVYALDRMMDMVVTDRPFALPKSFHAERFFEHYFGIDRRGGKPVKIHVRVAADTANYLRTLPLHDSQVEVAQTDTHSEFVFFVVPTYDFIQELRKHGPNLEILAPADLRTCFRRDYKKAAQLYK